jgi:hypothetical protein
MKKRVLFAIQYYSYFRPLIEVMRVIKARTEWEPVVYFSSVYATVAADMAVCDAEGIRCVKGFNGGWVEPVPVTVQPSVSGLKRLIRKIRCSLGNSFPWLLYWRIRQYAEELRRFRRVIDAEPFHLLVQGGDNVGSNTALFIKECHRRGIKSVVMPSWMVDANEAFENYACDEFHSLKMLSNRIFGWLFPNCLYAKNGHQIIRWHSSEVAAMKIFGVYPPKPWILHSGYADIIAVENQYVYDLMAREGLPSWQVMITGSVAIDVMTGLLKQVENGKSQLYAQFGLDIGKPFILTSLHPEYQRPGCEFRDYASLVEAWLLPLVKMGTHHVIVSVHPAVPLERVCYIEKFGVKIARQRITDLIPLCDFFVAYSATVQWAIACSKPVIGYDVYRFDYPDFRDAKAFYYVQSHEGYVAYIHRLTRDQEFFKNACIMQQSNAGYWGNTDGRGAERIIALFEGLMT